MATIEKGRKLMTLKDNPKARPHMQAAAALASFEPIVCEVVDSITADK
jgi:hypothetical protein